MVKFEKPFEELEVCAVLSNYVFSCKKLHLRRMMCRGISVSLLIMRALSSGHLVQLRHRAFTVPYIIKDQVAPKRPARFVCMVLSV